MPIKISVAFRNEQRNELDSQLGSQVQIAFGHVCAFFCGYFMALVLNNLMD